MTATCDFIGKDTLFMHWNDVPLAQTFEKLDPNEVRLRMGRPDSAGEIEPVMDVILSERK